MSGEKEKTIDRLLGEMDLDEKIGQCLTLEFAGTFIQPYVVDFVTRYKCAGLRITPHIYTVEPYGTHLDLKGAAVQRLSPYAMPDAYARLLNEVQDLALGTRLGIPLYFSSDQEGDFSQDYARGGVHLFPSAMGIAASGDPGFAYECYKAVARQQRAVGVRMLHTPCLDVNINPRNPEICTRSFGDDPETVAEFGLAQLRGFRDAGIIATGKHFPGRGDSEVDVHFTLDVNKADRKRLDEVELLPYRRLIAEGLPAVMTAHTVYEALDPDNPASVSRRIVTGLLREELGFQGVITSDAIGMRGVIDHCGSYAAACAEAIAAGNDLVLAKGDPSNIPKAVAAIKEYVEAGKIPEDELDRHVRRVLSLKWDYGVFREPKVEPQGALDVLKDPAVYGLSREAAERAAIVVRDRKGLLPLKAEQKIFYTDQHYFIYTNKADDVFWHSHMMAEFLRRHSSNVTDWETGLEVSREDEEKVLSMAREADVCVVHSVWWRGNPTNVRLAVKMMEMGKPVVLIAGVPYENVALPEADCLIVTFGSTPRCLENAAALLFGKGKAEGRWPLRHYSLEE